MLHWGWGLGWVGAIPVAIGSVRQKSKQNEKNGLTPVKRMELRVRCGNIAGLGRKSGMYVSKPGTLRQASARQRCSRSGTPRGRAQCARAARTAAHSHGPPSAPLPVRILVSFASRRRGNSRARAAARAGAAGRVREPRALPGLPTLTRPALGVPAPEPGSVALAGSRGPLRWLGAGVRCAGCSPAE